MKHCLDVKWIRVTDEGRKQILSEYTQAGSGSPSEFWKRFAGDVWDYRETCSRNSHSHSQTWRTRARRALLWLAERLTDV